MKRSNVLIGVLTTALLAGSVSAYAASNGPGGDGPRGQRGPSFETLDVNGDGAVTMAELEQMGADRFNAADTDGSGTLTAEELMAARDAQEAERANKRLTRMIERRDANNDGVLSLDEMQDDRRASRFFERFDADEDGTVTAEEFETARAEFGGRRGPGRGHNGPEEASE